MAAVEKSTRAGVPLAGRAYRALPVVALGLSLSSFLAVRCRVCARLHPLPEFADRAFGTGDLPAGLLASELGNVLLGIGRERVLGLVRRSHLWPALQFLRRPDGRLNELSFRKGDRPCSQKPHRSQH
jgi:hypothetical protein